MKTFECAIELGKIHAVREANNKEEFVRELVKEFNSSCGVFIEIDERLIKDITEIDNES